LKRSVLGVQVIWFFRMSFLSENTRPGTNAWFVGLTSGLILMVSRQRLILLGRLVSWKRRLWQFSREGPPPSQDCLPVAVVLARGGWGARLIKFRGFLLLLVCHPNLYFVAEHFFSCLGGEGFGLLTFGKTQWWYIPDPRQVVKPSLLDRC